MHLTGAWRALFIAPLLYVGLFVIVRMLGKRTIATMNAFDLLVTVALGSTVATIILSSEVTLAEGFLSLAIPLTLQFGAIWISSRHEPMEHLLKDHPALLVYDGELRRDMLEHEMITDDEVREAVRKAGLGSWHQAKAVVLEVDGQISVLRQDQQFPDDESSSLLHVAQQPKDTM